MEKIRETKTENTSRRLLNRMLAIAITLAVLYVPQSWYFLMDYPWSDYRLFWLKFFPGLPAFRPMAIFTHPNEWAMLVSTWLVTALIGGGLYFASRRSTAAFGILATATAIWSIVSALGAYAVFRH